MDIAYRADETLGGRVIVACSACRTRFEAGYRDVHCPACGAMAPQGPTPPWPDDDIPLPERSCVACFRPVIGQRVAGIALYICDGCGGCFVDTKSISMMLTEANMTRVDAVIEALARRTPRNTVDSKAPRRCPTCINVMTRALSPEGAGVIIDVCRPHGVFFDAGELRRMLEFARREARERKELIRHTPLKIEQGSETREMYLPQPHDAGEAFAAFAWIAALLDS
jgi:Zn-finger nucleic acid-binding protein